MRSTAAEASPFAVDSGRQRRISFCEGAQPARHGVQRGISAPAHEVVNEVVQKQL